MRQELCSIYDKRAQQYSPPMAFQTLGVAERAFHDAVHDTQSNIHKHPEDYQLYQIGHYDTDTAIMTQMAPHLICEATQLKG